MTFDEILAQACGLLQREGRVSYRALKRRLALDDEDLEDLKAELIDAKRLAIDEDGKVLVWTGASLVSGSKFQVPDPEASSQQPETSNVSPLSQDSGLGTQHFSPSDARPQTLDARPTAGERRQLTVMFCDLVGSTPLAERLDPEDLREVVRAYQETCTAVIHRFDGYIARYVGDALLVYFGYPAAHEDDAQRAVRTGLGIVAALPQLNARLQSAAGVQLRLGPSTEHIPLQVRIGIHTGLVVVGELGGRDYREAMALGETPNIAARLQGLAEPDTVVISAATSRLVAGLFAFRTFGPQTLKGVSTPIEVYHVLGESGVQSRFEVAVSTGLTPLIGREQEVGLLLERWDRAKEGSGQVVMLNGEPGIGKSRLLQVLKERVASEAATQLECRCSPYYQNSALYPVIDLLQRVLGFTREDSPEEKLHKLEVGARRAVPLQPEVIPLLSSLLSLPPSDCYPSLTLTPQKQKEKTLQAILTWLLKAAERQPLCLAVEDLHWADPSTLELLGLLIEQAPTARLFLVLTSRPEFTPPWAMRSHVTQLTLSRLARTQTERMVEQVAGDKALPSEVLQQIVSKTDGVPLFVEELTKTVVESGLSVGATHASPVPPLAIPATLHDSLMARLDRLGTAKEVAQLGASLGREFSYELIQAVSPVDEATLQQALGKLVEAEVLYQRGLLPQTRYLFKHALIQDAAYQSLLKSIRQQYHQQIGQVLEEQFAETKDLQPELLAHHYTEAGLREQAIPYWQRAGHRASQRSANVEAISHLTKGMELLKTFPDTPERAQQELTLQVALGSALIFTKGFGTPEVEHAYTRARELCQRVGETPQLVPVLWGLCYFYSGKGDVQTATELREQLMRVAQRTQDPAALILAHRMEGAHSYWWRGEFAAALEHCGQVLTLYDRQRHQALTSLSALDSEVYCQGYMALALWHLGYPDQALTRVHEALTLARALAHLNSLINALTCAVMLSELRGEVQAVQEEAEALIALATEQGLPFFLALGTMELGWVLGEQGHLEEGIARICQGLAGWQATGQGLGQSYFLALLAEAYSAAGQVKEGLNVLDEALDAAHKTEECLHEAELYRLKGQLVLQFGV
ncbi:MAG TPA: adenylate/guanylate cyclase domain-containing protein [Candidatus Binatia bacterium]|jgi:predicted ATPase/class 3 adenylate cyclase|nr:adenylate/guanylate cyclase domain-containing protein [Candidatus Binatia bacterium]